MCYRESHQALIIINMAKAKKPEGEAAAAAAQGRLHHITTASQSVLLCLMRLINPFQPTVAIWVQL